jgi:putative endonuclease
MAAHNELGKQGEDIAAGFLEAKGFHILDRNYRFERAEIDLVALQIEPAELVFAEVKSRSSDEFGFPEEAVDQQKQRQMIKAADSYLYEKQMSTVPVRFDIIAINLRDPENPLIKHIEDAFRMEGGGWQDLSFE